LTHPTGSPLGPAFGLHQKSCRKVGTEEEEAMNESEKEKSAPPPFDRRQKQTSAGDGRDSGNEAATAVLDDLEALRQRTQTVEQERDEFRNLLQRTRADFENYQKRVQRDLSQERRYWHGALALDLLPILDNFDRAVEAARQAGESGPLMQGVALIQSQMLDMLRRHGITPIDALGKPFDPNLHQAVMQQPSDQPPNTVVGVLEKGFMIHDRVLRPARVAVAAAAQGKS
jgi:molecular chaperone GrpE